MPSTSQLSDRVKTLLRGTENTAGMIASACARTTAYEQDLAAGIAAIRAQATILEAQLVAIEAVLAE